MGVTDPFIVYVKSCLYADTEVGSCVRGEGLVLMYCRHLRSRDGEEILRKLPEIGY
jgi:hypothetical protein